MNSKIATLGFLCISAGLAAISSPSAAAIPPARVSNSAPVNELVAKARTARQSNNMQLALIYLKNAISAEPKNGMVRAELGESLLFIGDAASAERELRQARHDGGPDTTILPLLFRAMLQRHEEQKLLDEFPESSATGPAAADLLLSRGLAFQFLGSPTDAAAAMDRSLAARRDVPGLLTRATLAQRQKDFSLANRLVSDAMKVAPDNLNAALFQVGLQLDEGDKEHAVAQIDQLVKRFPENLQIRLAHVEIMLRLKRDSDAKVDADYVLSKHPNAPMGIYYRAILMARAGDAKGAWHIAQSLQKEFLQLDPDIGGRVASIAQGAGQSDTAASILGTVIATFPRNATARARLAALRLQQNSAASALAILQPVRDTHDPMVLELMAQAYSQMRRYPEALQAFNDLQATGINTDSVQRDIALLKLQMGRVDDAIIGLKAAVAKKPTDAALVGPLMGALSREKRFAEALEVATRFGADPKNATQALLYKGLVLTAQQDFNSALSAYGDAIKNDPKNTSALYARANIFASQGRFEEASQDLKTLLAIDGKNGAALLRLAEIEVRMNQDQAVRETLARAISVTPKNPVPRVTLVRYLSSRKDFNGALDAAVKFQDAIPGNFDALVFVADLQASMGRKADAVATLKKLAAYFPRESRVQVMLANALFAAGDRAGSGQAIRAALKLSPDSISAQAAQINLNLAAGDAKGAIAAAGAFRTHHNTSGADLLLAETFLRTNQAAQAIAVLAQSLQQRPTPLVALQLSHLMLSTGDAKGAAAVLDKWLQAHSNDLIVRQSYASLLMQLGQKASSAKEYQVILKQDPSNVPAMNNLGWLLQKDNPKQAANFLTSALKAAPNSPDVMDSLGWVKVNQKDVVGGLDLLNKAHTLRPADDEISYHLAVALDANGKRDAAGRLLRSTLSKNSKFTDRADAVVLEKTWH
jgi:putative PEP-CTERM system TPR-repeat lipoprotein